MIKLIALTIILFVSSTTPPTFILPSSWTNFPTSLASSTTPQFLPQATAVAQLYAPDDLDFLLNNAPSLVDATSSQMLHGVTNDFSMLKLVVLEDGTSWTGYPPKFPIDSLSYSESCRLLFNKGFSLLINKLQRRSPIIAHLANSVASIFLADNISVNLYFTPTDSQGFEAHYDWMDVLVLQTSGSKNWTVYDDVQLKSPLTPLHKEKPSLAALGAFTTYTLDEGDALFIPRGYIHEAKTETAPSLHLTFGIERDELGSIFGFVKYVLESSHLDLSFAVETLNALVNDRGDGSFLRHPLEGNSFKHFSFALLRVHMSLNRGDNFDEYERRYTEFLGEVSSPTAFNELHEKFVHVVREKQSMTHARNVQDVAWSEGGGESEGGGGKEEL